VTLPALSKFIVWLRERLGKSSPSKDEKKPAFQPRSPIDLTGLVRNDDSQLSEQDYESVGMLKIHDLMNNEFVVSQGAGVETVLRKQEGDGVNCFWLWQEKMETPILIIHVNKDLTKPCTTFRPMIIPDFTPRAQCRDWTPTGIPCSS
jgi:hypothetical protein